VEGHGVDVAAVVIIHTDALTGGHVPDAHCLVITARDSQAAVRAEAAAPHPVAVA